MYPFSLYKKKTKFLSCTLVLFIKYNYLLCNLYYFFLVIDLHLINKIDSTDNRDLIDITFSLAKNSIAFCGYKESLRQELGNRGNF